MVKWVEPGVYVVYVVIKKILPILLISFVFSGFIWPKQIEMKSVTVAGFINKGKANQGNINIMMVKSLTTFLSKISKKITPYKEVEETARGSGFWDQKEFNSGGAINIAQQFSTEQVITGDYLVNEQSGTININVYVYNVINGQLLFGRNYKGNAGPEIFNTIDKMILDVSGLLVGKTISLGYFKLAIKPLNTKYRLFIDDSFVKLVNNKDGYFDKFITGQSIDISLKSEKSDEEALRKIIEIKSGKTNELEYNPSGVLILETMKDGIDVYLNGIKIGKTDSSGEFKIPNIEAGKENEITLKNGSELLSGTNIVIKEGDTKVVVFKTAAALTGENDQIKSDQGKPAEEIEVSASVPLGTKYIAAIPGIYKFVIERGTFNINHNSPYISKILVYTNRDVIWVLEGMDRTPINFDYQMGSDEAENIYKKAEKKVKGQSITIIMKEGDFVIFVPKEKTMYGGSYEGGIYISVSK